MLGQSPAFRAMCLLIRKIAEFDAPVLILGETGSGKELAARAIHYGSSRRDHPFVPVNCGAIPDLLLENELFGHRRGAYTDARQDHAGLIASAAGGTLFLDEVDALSAKAQVSLLRFLQDNCYSPLGTARVQRSDTRVLAASNADLLREVEAGRFRSDLYFRLRVLTLPVPPLRERPGDPLLLADHFVGVFATRFKLAPKNLSPSTLAWIYHYAWPGNIRELENLVCQGFLLGEERYIHIDPPVHPSDLIFAATLAAVPSGGLDFRVAKQKAIEQFERQFLLRVMTQSQGNVSRAAIAINKERRALGKLLKKYGLAPSQFCAAVPPVIVSTPIPPGHSQPTPGL
jgi:DNA-binding NtrC family response regulator